MSSRILVIEDHPDTLQLMSLLLQGFGYIPLLASHGELGLKMANEQRPDLIIVDIQLPEIDGYEVARTLKSNPLVQDIPLVAVTAYAMSHDRSKALEAGFDAYVPKPIDPEVFVSQIEAYLPAHRQGAKATTRPHPGALAAAPAASINGQKIRQRGNALVIDETPPEISLLCKMLESMSYRVHSAGDIASAHSVAQSCTPHLMVLSVLIGGKSTWDLLSALKADPTLTAVPLVVIASSEPDDKEERLALALGADKYVRRPIDPEIFVNAVGSILQKA